MENLMQLSHNISWPEKHEINKIIIKNTNTMFMYSDCTIYNQLTNSIYIKIGHATLFTNLTSSGTQI